MKDITYSPSRIGAFDDCKLKYKYHYIDRLESDLEAIETFRGGIVHKVLEGFYKLVKGGVVKPLDWVLNEYKDLWDKNYTDSIKIVKKDFTAQDYFDKGRQCLIDYYEKYKPFDQAKVVQAEQALSFTIRHDGIEVKFRGILDRLDWNDKANMFEIHDYKVTNTLMTQEEADSNWQLGLYYVALKQKWPDIKKAKLVWHSLLFNKEIVSSRTEVQAGELQKDVIEKVKEIESCSDFYPQKSALCDWCDFQNICPLWKHPKKMEELSVNEYKKDPGVKLVAKYAEFEEAKNELKEKIYEIEEEQEKVKEAAIEFAEREKISIIDGPTAQLKVNIKDELKAPSKADDSEGWTNLRKFLIKENKYEDASTVSGNMVNHKIRKRLWPPDFIEKVEQFLKRQVTKTVKLVKKTKES